MLMVRARMKPSSSKSKDETFQLFITCIYASNSNAKMRLSSTSIDKARVKSLSSKSKNETFQLSLLLMKNN